MAESHAELDVKIATADLSDAHPKAQVAESLFRDFGGVKSFYGPVVTAKVFEDNVIVRELLQEPGEGRCAAHWSAAISRNSASTMDGVAWS